MNTPELKQLKMAWLAAKEAGDTQEQSRLLREYPSQQDELINFIAAYNATADDEDADPTSGELLPISQRAYQTALQRVFEAQAAFTSLTELRKNRNLSKTEASRGLRLSVDVWNKFENGAIELFSLTQRQMGYLAQYFQVTIDQFSQALNGSQPTFTLNRRQTSEAARQSQQGPQKQTLQEAIDRSTMTKEDKQFWLE
jgi:transcriptional regulator with XRE-family HTH domain